jgi:hypothetical protein
MNHNLAFLLLAMAACTPIDCGGPVFAPTPDPEPVPETDSDTPLPVSPVVDEVVIT